MILDFILILVLMIIQILHQTNQPSTHVAINAQTDSTLGSKFVDFRTQFIHNDGQQLQNIIFFLNKIKKNTIYKLKNISLFRY